MGDWWVSLFTGLFLFRYLRFVVNCIGYFCYRPAKAPTGRRKFSNKDVSVILPTIDPTGPDFQECIRTCAQNSPKAIFVVTTAGERFETTKKIVEPFRKEFPSTKFKVLESEIANKRRQVAVAIPHVKTALTLMLDDHVFWGPHFLQSAVLPFEDDTVGLVGTNKMARRVPNLGLTARFFNMLGCLYLTRHNFEIRATNAIDGGVFVISARTCIIRTRIITDQQFLDGYKNEMFFFGKYGPLNPDDDNFLTRYVVRQGWRIKVQYTPEACIETTVGIAQPIVTKFLGQCLRWARTTWRSNACSLFTDRSIWSFQPWCVYAVFLSSFTNFAFFVDGGLMGLLLKSSLGSLRFFGVPTPYLLMMWILFTKLVKVLPYFWQYPQDLPFFIGYLGFAYYHSYIKVKSLFTFWDCQWTGRNL
ncbi:nucleotide-diphospho-sugar transferase, partial [Echria macrotheca]